MTPKPSVLVAVDFSDGALTALRQAVRLAGALERRLVILHVVHDPAWAPGFYGLPTGDSELRTLEDAAGELMVSFLKRAEEEGIDLLGAETRLVPGVVATRILEVAEFEAADLIVLGAQGRHAAARFVLGSVASRLVRISNRPVLVVPNEETSG